MSFWQYISLRISQLISKAKGNTMGVVFGPAAEGLVGVETALKPKTAGQMSTPGSFNLGEAIYKIFSPVRFVFLGMAAAFFVWVLIRVLRRR